MEAGTLRSVKEGYCALCYAKAKDKCQRCKRPYCSQACQQKDWLLGHKGDCGLADLPPLATVPSPPARMLRESVEQPVITEASWRKVLDMDAGLRAGPPRGLRNLGNTCYLNSVLQGLYHAAPALIHSACREASAGSSSPSFRRDLAEMAGACLEPRSLAEAAEEPEASFKPGDRVILQGLNRQEMNGWEGIIEGRVPQDLSTDDARIGVRLRPDRTVAIKPQNLAFGCRAADGPTQVVRWLPRLGEFNFGTQEDAHELLRSLLRLVEDEELREHGGALRQGGGGEDNRGALPEPNADLTAAPSRLFGGLLVSQCTCTHKECAASSFSFEAFMDLSLDITEATDSIEDALRLFTAPERLDKKNGWRCETCSQVTRAHKQLTIYSAPALLVVQLKRFRFGGVQNKVTRPLAFGATLNLRPYLWRHSAMESEDGKPLLYELRAIVVHLDKAGFSHFGHYIAFVRRRAPEGTAGGSSRWYVCDDSQVCEVSESEVLRQQAYLLLYARCSAASAEGAAPAPREPMRGAVDKAEVEAGAPGRCRGRQGAVCSFYACCDGLCSSCYQEEHGKPPPADAMASSPAPPAATPAGPGSAGYPGGGCPLATGSASSVSGSTASPSPPANKAPAPSASPHATKALAPSVGGKSTKKVGMNDKCPCGSGLKYKKCHGQK